MTTLIIGFDSAWTPKKSGAIVGVLRNGDGTLKVLSLPEVADFHRADQLLIKWQAQYSPARTIVAIDQPTIVPNPTGQRPVENIVSSAVCRRRGGMQPANTGKTEMFGPGAPIWSFLPLVGGPANPLGQFMDTGVFETYPALVMIALGWTLPDSRATGRLPKYNPTRRKTYSISAWRFVCEKLSDEFRSRDLFSLVQRLKELASVAKPSKSDQDGIDACICLLVALHMADGKQCLMVGDMNTGYIVVPYGADLHTEIGARCLKTRRAPSQWVQQFRLRCNQENAGAEVKTV